jgi:phosphoribosyl 1,2-cyclic phosphodiesterase
MKIRFWGVRGSIPVPGMSTVRYGGNTSCVEVQADGQPPLVLDCGTGARLLGQHLLARGERKLHMLFTHFHLDHLFGFPFFAPLFTPNFEISVTAPTFSAETTRDRVSRYLNGILHPLRLYDVPAKVDFDAIRPGLVVDRPPYRVRAISLNHPGGSCGYRIEYDHPSGRRQVVVYITDTAPLSRPGEGVSGGMEPNAREVLLIEGLQGADVVIFDTMFSHEEYLEKMSWGHSYPEYAVGLCERAGVGTLYLFHHAPDASDEDMDRLAARWQDYAPLRVRVAREGVDVDLEG